MMHEGARATYRIGAVARMTGISTHALRMWERRYGTFSSARSPAGGRLYTAGDVQRLSDIRRLTEQGHSIGAVATLSAAQLSGLARGDATAAIVGAAADARQRLLDAIEAMDSDRMHRELGALGAGWPVADWATEVLAPVLHLVGERWQAGEVCVAQEHAWSAALRDHLGALLHVLDARAHPGRRLVVTTLAGERHELGALMAAVVAASQRWRVSYLGPDLPVEEIVRAATTAQARWVLLSMSARTRPAAVDAARELVKALPRGIGVVAGGAGSRALRDDEGVHVIDDYHALAGALGG